MGSRKVIGTWTSSTHTEQDIIKNGLRPGVGRKTFCASSVQLGPTGPNQIPRTCSLCWLAAQTRNSGVPLGTEGYWLIPSPRALLAKLSLAVTRSHGDGHALLFAQRSVSSQQKLTLLSPKSSRYTFVLGVRG